jgi:hypothetical protein
MKVKTGSTRVVILTADHAIKVAKIRIFRFLLRLIAMIFSSYQRKRFRKKYGQRFWDAARSDILYGLLANKNEYNYYRRTFDTRVAPITLSLFGGLVVVQRRGGEVTRQEIAGLDYISLHRQELDTPNQFKRFGDKILLCDYGHLRTVSVLMKSRGETLGATR